MQTFAQRSAAARKAAATRAARKKAAEGEPRVELNLNLDEVSVKTAEEYVELKSCYDVDARIYHTSDEEITVCTSCGDEYVFDINKLLSEVVKTKTLKEPSSLPGGW